MVLAYHVIITAYGFWLPNDERGSWSDFVRRWELLKYGPATKVDTRRSVARRPYSAALRATAKRALMYRPVIFDGMQTLCIGKGFGDGVKRSGYVIHACCILPDHVHPMRDQVAADEALPSPWAVGLWKVYLDSVEDIRRAIDYVEKNPEKERKKRQNWSFVKAY